MDRWTVMARLMAVEASLPMSSGRSPSSVSCCRRRTRPSPPPRWPSSLTVPTRHRVVRRVPTSSPTCCGRSSTTSSRRSGGSWRWPATCGWTACTTCCRRRWAGRTPTCTGSPSATPGRTRSLSGTSPRSTCPRGTRACPRRTCGSTRCWPTSATRCSTHTTSVTAGTTRSPLSGCFPGPTTPRWPGARAAAGRARPRTAVGRTGTTSSSTWGRPLSEEDQERLEWYSAAADPAAMLAAVEAFDVTEADAAVRLVFAGGGPGGVGRGTGSWGGQGPDADPWPAAMAELAHRAAGPWAGVLVDMLDGAGLDRPVLVDADVATRMVAPFVWMVRHVGASGVALTGAGYLRPADVRAAAVRALWWACKDGSVIPGWQVRRMAELTVAILDRLGVRVHGDFGAHGPG